MSSSLELIVGPVFSGKTTRLIERYNELTNSGKKCIAINYSSESSDGNNKMVSHDGLSIDCISMTNLDENLSYNSEFVQAEFVLINDAQFFNKLKISIRYLIIILKKNVILCGLDLDYKREKFCELMELASSANKIEFLRGKCSIEGCKLPSKFTDQIGTNKYIPVCQKCYKGHCTPTGFSAKKKIINFTNIEIYNETLY